MLLTRSDIINGTFERKEVMIELLGQEISLRPLTDGEFNAIEAIKKDIGKVKTLVKVEKGKEDNIDIEEAAQKAEAEQKEKEMELELDLRKTEEQKYYADCLAAAYGLSNDREKFHPSDIKNMRPVGVVHEIAEAVIRISKLEDPLNLDQEVKTFRGE